MRSAGIAAAIAATVLTPAAVMAAGAQRHPTPAAIIRHVFRTTAPTARCFAYRESTLQPTATHLNDNGTVDHGLFQINDIWAGTTVQWYRPRAGDVPGQGVRIEVDVDLLLGARYNARVAWAISRGGTYWKAWGWTC